MIKKGHGDIVYCKHCGKKLIIAETQVGYDEYTGNPVVINLRYCPLFETTISLAEAYLKGTLLLGYYHGHYYSDVYE